MLRKKHEFTLSPPRVALINNETFLKCFLGEAV